MKIPIGIKKKVLTFIGKNGTTEKIQELSEETPRFESDQEFLRPAMERPSK